MEDMLNKKGTEIWNGVLEAAIEAKGLDPVVLDLQGHCSWTDYMLIVTATSRIHLRGIYQKILDSVKDNESLLLRSGKGSRDENQWLLMDFGSLVVQIFTEEARQYYDLEKIWFESEVLFKEENHSSSSS